MDETSINHPLKPIRHFSTMQRKGNVIDTRSLFVKYFCYCTFIPLLKKQLPINMKDVCYLSKKIESLTYEKMAQIELNQIRLQRHNVCRVGISPSSEERSLGSIFPSYLSVETKEL